MRKKVQFSRRFQGSYKARIFKDEQLTKHFWECVEAFLTDRTSVDDHQLEGKMGKFRAFSITDDIRVVYLETADYFLFINVGTHEEVYYR